LKIDESSLNNDNLVSNYSKNSEFITKNNVIIEKDKKIIPNSESLDISTKGVPDNINVSDANDVLIDKLKSV